MSGPSPWTDERDQQLTADWAAGFTTSQIGKRMGISKNSVIGRAHRLRLPSRGLPINLTASQSWTEADDATLRQLHGGFLSAAEIGARMCRSLGQISYRAKFLGLVARRRATSQSRAVVARPAARSNRELPVADTRAASPSRPRAASISGALSSAVERLGASPQVENLPGAVAETPPRRVFFDKKCQYITSSADRAHRFCEAPVVENARGRPSAFCATHFDLCLVSPKKALEERKAQRAADIEAGRVRWNPPSAWR